MTVSEGLTFMLSFPDASNKAFRYSIHVGGLHAGIEADIVPHIRGARDEILDLCNRLWISDVLLSIRHII